MAAQSFDAIVVFITVPSPEVGGKLARTLVEERLAACVNLVPGITSTYRWQGEVQVEPESLLIVKTGRDLYDALAARVRALHPYTVPEIIALPLAAGNEPYLQWIADSTVADGREPSPAPGQPPA
jgi:periplasmic divalent cation tolerance protein